MSKQVWDTKVPLFMGDAVYTHLYVYVDPASVQGASLERGFTFQADVRAAGVDVFSTGAVTLKNGPITATPIIPGGAALGNVQGEIDNWNFTSGAWNTTTGVQFLVLATADISIPVSEIVRLVPGLGTLVGGVIGGLVGSLLKVRITLGHENIMIPIARDAAGNVVSINGVSIS